MNIYFSETIFKSIYVLSYHEFKRIGRKHKRTLHKLSNILRGNCEIGSSYTEVK